LKQRNILIIAVVVVIALIGTSWYMLRPNQKENLIVSTTTSLYETGFLDVLKAGFEAKYPNYNVSFISQGTGLAIETAKRGDADMIMVHDPNAELAFLNGSYGVDRKIIAYNFFIIVGPQSDPAGIKGLAPLDALRKIAAAGPNGSALWVSRGDNSGTYSKEKALWKAADLNLTQIKGQRISGTNNPWYIEAGAGMTATLQLSNQKGAYTLSDIASFLKNSKEGNIQLVNLVQGGKEMLNVYSAIAVNPQKVTQAKFETAILFIKFLVSDEGQNLFGTFGAQDYGQAVFKPWITTYKTNSDPTLIQWVKEYAFFNGTECPDLYRYKADDLFS